MIEHNLSNWEEFEGLLNKIRASPAGEGRRNSPLLFRGQENARWDLRTTLDRRRERMPFKDYYGIISRVRPQIETLTSSEWPIPDYPEVMRDADNYDKFSMALWSGRWSGYAYMAYLRHHGFPSPLLDWTRSPYVAAFFAFHKAGTAGEPVAIYAFAETPSKPMSNLIPVVYRLGPYVRAHRRHVLQQSEYTVCTGFNGTTFFESYSTVFNEGRYQQGLCWKFVLPAIERAKVLGLLDEHNLNAFSLMGSEDSLMETLAVREFDLSVRI
jgi:FRG domain